MELERIVDELERANDALSQIRDQTFTTQFDVDTIKDRLAQIETSASSIDHHVQMIEIQVSP